MQCNNETSPNPSFRGGEFRASGSPSFEGGVGKVLPTAYLGSVDWYRTYLQNPQAVRIEVLESFPKQTYRNRCTVTTPDGPLTLTVPVKKAESKQLTRDVEISYQTRWRHQHWMSIVSAYRRTPYFDYFEEYFRPFYERETKYLIDLNNGLHEVIMQLLNRSMKPIAGYSLQPTTDWMGQDLELCFGSGCSILDELFNSPNPLKEGACRVGEEKNGKISSN